MAVYTPKELVPVTQLTNTAATVYTTPGATVGVMRTIQVSVAAAAHTFTLSRGTDGAATRLFAAYALTANVPAIFNGWWALTAASIVQANADANALVNLTISGYEFA